MEIEELVKDLAKYVSINAWRESAFLTPHPEHLINAHSLLDHISEVTGISKQTIGKWCEED